MFNIWYGPFEPKDKSMFKFLKIYMKEIAYNEGFGENGKYYFK